MLSRWIPSVALVLVTAGAAQAQPAKAPALVVRVQSLDTLIDNAKLVGGLVGKEDFAEMFQDLIKQRIGKNGLEGVDTKRPIGFYGNIGENIRDVVGVALVPISDEKAVLSLLENLNLKLEKGKQGIYHIAAFGKGKDIYFRFHKNYAYITAVNDESLKTERLVDPGEVFSAKDTSTVSATLRIERLSKAVKDFAIMALEEKVEEAKKAPASKEERALRDQALSQVLEKVKVVIEEGRELTATVNLLPKSKELSVRVSLIGKPGSTLAKNISQVGAASSVFGGIKNADAVFTGRVHFTLPEPIAKNLRQAFKEGMDKALQVLTQVGKEKEGEALVKTLGASFEKGELDLFGQVIPKGKQFTVLAGVKLQQGDKLGKIIRDLAEDLLKLAPEDEQAKVKLDADSVGKIKIHRVDVQSKFDDKTKALLGNHPLYLAFKADALMIGLGPDGLAALKKGLAAPAAASPPFEIELSMARIAPLLAKTDAQREALDAFKGNDGRIRVTLSGGKTLQLHFTTRLSVIQFFAQFAAAAKARP